MQLSELAESMLDVSSSAAFVESLMKAVMVIQELKYFKMSTKVGPLKGYSKVVMHQSEKDAIKGKKFYSENLFVFLTVMFTGLGPLFSFFMLCRHLAAGKANKFFFFHFFFSHHLQET